MGKSGHFVGRIDYTAKDIRFTRSKDSKNIYAITLGWPSEDLLIKSMLVQDADKGKISLLGYDDEISFNVNKDKQLQINSSHILPINISSQYAYVYKLTGFRLEANPDALFHSPQAIQLLPDQATLEGHQKLLGEGDLRSIGAWDMPKDRIHWLVRIKEPGTYKIRGKFSTAGGETKLTTSFGEQNVTAIITQTDGWLDAQYFNLGQFIFEKEGVYQMTLSPSDEEYWKPVFVFGVQLANINLD
jgi:hypothetical protein